MSGWRRRSGLTRRTWLTRSGGALTVMAGCAPGTPEGSDGAGPGRIKPGTQVRLHVRVGTEVDTLNERIPLLEQQQGIKVEVEPFPQTEYFDKIQTLVAGDSLGDVIWGASSTGLGHLWAHSGVVRFVDDLVRAEKFDLSAYYPSAIEGSKFEGKLYGLPYKLQPGPMGLYYNVDALAKAGQPPPDANTTFAQLAELSRRLTQPGTLWGFFGTGENPGYQFAVVYVRAWGGDVISDDGKKSQMATPAAVEAVRWYRDLIFQHQAAPPANQTQNADFEKGQVALLQSGSWSKSIPVRVKDAFRVLNTLMPRGPSGRRGSMGVTDFLAVTRRSASAAEAWALTKHLTDRETGIRLGEGGVTGASGTSGGRKDVFHSERLLANPLHKVWIEAAENALPLKVPWNFLGEEHQKVLNEGLNPILRGEAAPNAATMAELDRRLQVVLDRPRPGK
ncbi:MAG TPA: sugar ABC transporter substrate-binding protein [Chloroflexota bacterium]|nr:sugar ABC transporter substrate-binding protein [Chloroflexota bacterium]